MAQLSVASWSEQMGMSRQAGYAAVKRCNIPVDGGMLDSDVATVLYRKRTRARTSERRGTDQPSPPSSSSSQPHDVHDDGDGGYWSSRTRREKAEAELAELKLAEQLGQLVRAADVRSSVSRRSAALRESFLQIPARVVPLLAADPNPAKMDQILRAEIVAALAHLTEAT